MSSNNVASGGSELNEQGSSPSMILPRSVPQRGSLQQRRQQQQQQLQHKQQQRRRQRQQRVRPSTANTIPRPSMTRHGARGGQRRSQARPASSSARMKRQWPKKNKFRSWRHRPTELSPGGSLSALRIPNSRKSHHTHNPDAHSLSLFDGTQLGQNDTAHTLIYPPPPHSSHFARTHTHNAP